MSCHVLPQPSPKKDVSRKEYTMLEEWAPQTLNAYHCVESPTATLAGPSQALTTPERNPTRRRKTRSSSLYEGWKSQASENDNTVMPTAVPTDNDNKQGLMSKTPVPRGPGGVEGIKGRRQRPAQAGGSTVRNLPKATNRFADSTSKEIKSANPGRPGPQSQKQHSNGGYTAPNGTYIGKEELAKLSNGVKIPNGDTMYFLPSFVADSWKGVQVMKTECLFRY